MDFHGCGMSVMEMSHRSSVFRGIIEQAEADLRELLNIPENYDVIFVQGGDSLLFASVFMNLARNGKADYILTGNWAKKAFKEAQILGDAAEIASSADKNLATFLIVQICLFVKIQVTSIYVRTTLFTELSILSSPIRRAIHS